MRSKRSSKRKLSRKAYRASSLVPPWEVDVGLENINDINVWLRMWGDVNSYAQLPQSAKSILRNVSMPQFDFTDAEKCIQKSRESKKVIPQSPL